MAILECVIFLLILNISTCDKYEPKLDDIAPSVQVSHYDCSEMTENNLYSLNQVKPCNMAPQNIQMNDVKLTMYTKHFRTEINATICRIKHQRNKFYCGMHDHTSMDIEQPQITSDIDLTPEQCKQASEGRSLTLFDHKLTFEKGKKEIHHKIIGDKDGDNRNECDGYEWITKDTFESHIQDITLKVRIKDGKIFNRNDQLLPCDLDELGCESTSLDPYAYTWKAPENCILSVLKEDYAHMLKNDNHYYIVSQNTSENKYLFEVKNHPQHLCNKPTEVYPTTYDSMYVAIHYGGFDMKTGRKLNELGPHLLQYQNNAFQSKPGNLYVYSPQPKPADPYINTWLNMDYELQQGTKLDYLFFESSRALQASELNLLKNQCEQERIQIFTILMLSLENPRLAGYMLTGNRSMFLETDGSLAWLYSCPQVRSPLHTLNQCYDKIPILYKGQIQFVDPITRQTLPDALPQNCSDPIKNLFQMDMDQKDSWYSLTPEITHRDRPAVFAPKDISPFTTQKFPQSAKAGMYTKGQLSEFWDAILMSSASKNALQKFTRNLIVPSNAKKGPDGYTYYAPRTDFFVDNMISPNYFENEFVQTFGTIGYWLEKCGIWFAIFLFVKLIIDIVVVVMRTLEIHRITGRSVNFGKVLLSATYNLFMVSILNSVYSPTKPIESSTPIAVEMQESTEHIYPSIQTLPNDAPSTISPI